MFYSVFYQFSGGVGPAAIHFHNDNLFVARFEFASTGGRGFISVLNVEGTLLRQFECPGSEVTGVAVHDQHLYITENTTRSVYRMSLRDLE